MIIVSTLFALGLVSTTCACPENFDAVSIMGHRGSGPSTSENLFAENTLPSFENAYKLGADYIELDVHLSADGQVVLIHDFLLDDTTNLKGCVGDFTYAQLSTADATVGTKAATRVGVPLLKDALALAAQYERKVNIEIKVDDAGKACTATDVTSLVGKTVAVVKSAKAEGRVIFSSFSFKALEQVKKELPEVPVGYLTAEGGENLLAEATRAANASFEAINPIFFVLTEDEKTFSALVETDLQIIPWTVNKEDAIRKLITSGADAIITDDTALALRVRNESVPVCECGGSVKQEEVDTGCNTASAVSWIPALFSLALLAGARRFRRI